MAKLTKKSRSKIARGNFVFPDGTKEHPDKAAFPIHDRKHAKSALARAAQKKVKLEKKERCLVVSRVCRKFPRLGLCDTGLVTKDSQLAHCSGLTASLTPRKKKASKAKAKKSTKKSTTKRTRKSAAPTIIVYGERPAGPWADQYVY